MTLAFAIALLIMSLRRQRWRLSFLWFWILVILFTQISMDMVWTLPLWAFIPQVSKFWINHFFGIKNDNYREYSGLAPYMGLTILTIFYPALLRPLCTLYFIVEWLILLAHIRRIYLRKGVDFLRNPGSRLRWLQILVFIQPVLYISASLEAIMITSAVLAIFLIYCLWHYTLDGSFDNFHQQVKYAGSNLEIENKVEIVRKLDRLISERKFFLQHDASIGKLAKELSTNIHHLSQVLNQIKEKTFFELTSGIRVQEAKDLLGRRDHEHLKIEEIANKVGYSSKSSFNTTFKKIVGRTPSDYKANVRLHKVERRPAKVLLETESWLGTFELVQNSTVMLISFFKVYFRNLVKNKVFALINLGGLLAGLSSVILTLVYLSHELSYDRFHTDYEHIYRIIWKTDRPQTRTPHPMAQQLVSDFAEVESGVSISPIYGPGLTLQSLHIRNAENNVMFKEPDAFLADSTFFSVFGFKLIIGNPKEVLNGVGEIVITESVARRYFGDENPLGKSLEFADYGFRGVVTGVMQDAPPNSHFHPKILASYVSMKSVNPEDPWWGWGDFGHFNYIKLKPNSDPYHLEASIPDWITNYRDFNPDDIRDMKLRRSYLALQPLKDIHLRSQIRWELENNSNIIYVYILVAAILFLVAICSINYINLSTARILERGKEVGIRRTLGASSGGISSQFVAESLVTCLVSWLMAYGISWLFFSQFLAVTGQVIPTTLLTQPEVLVTSLLMTMVIGVVTGLYPSFFIRDIQLVQVLKGQFTRSNEKNKIIRFFVGVQFVVSSLMIFGSLVIINQVKYMVEMPLGFDETQLLVMELQQGATAKVGFLIEEIESIPGVMQVGATSNIPGAQFNQNVIYSVERPNESVGCSELRVDFNALQTLQLKIIEGRGFQPGIAQDSAGNNFVVNRSAFEALNLDRPFEETIMWDEEAAIRPGKIVGVVEDFHYKSLREPIQPMVIHINPSALNYLLIRLEKGKAPQEVMPQIEKIHRKVEERFDMEVISLDNQLDRQYITERQSLDLFRIFTGLALALASLGLLGLVYLAMVQRTKEIGVRKVMGASFLDLLSMESKSFLRIIGISLIVALPVGHLLMQQWLNAFFYRTPFQVFPFMITIFIIIGVAVVSVFLAVVRTVFTSPTEALRQD